MWCPELFLKVKNAIESDDRNLEIIKKSNEEMRLLTKNKESDVRSAQMMPGKDQNYIKIAVVDDILILNEEIFFGKKYDSQRDLTILHELTHIFGTDDVGDSFQNAHRIQELMTVDFKDWSAFEYELKIAKQCVYFCTTLPAPDLEPYAKDEHMKLSERYKKEIQQAEFEEALREFWSNKSSANTNEVEWSD